MGLFPENGENEMNSEVLVIYAALFLALFMSFKPGLFIVNPKHRNPRVEHTIKYIGISVGLVLAVWILISFRH